MQNGRGHRMGIMALDGNYTNAGIAIVAEDNPNTQVGPYVATANYAEAADKPDHYNQFIVGTVWSDDNANQQYDPGEGGRRDRAPGQRRLLRGDGREWWLRHSEGRGWGTYDYLCALRYGDILCTYRADGSVQVDVQIIVGRAAFSTHFVRLS
ncbi:MAG: hypothetical protein R2911_36790 [Caldilineaceae bacterium]